MKFINYLEKVSGIDIYGMISLCIFVTFFMVMLILVFKMKKSTITELENIPLNQ